MENTYKLLMEINNIIFDNKEKMNDKDYIEIQNKSKKIFDELNNLSDFIDKLNEFSGLFDELNTNDNSDDDNSDDEDSDDEDDDYIEPEEEKIELYSDTYWELKKDKICFLENTRTEVGYWASINEIFPNLKKVEFRLEREFLTGNKVNRKVKINFNNKKSLYRFVDFE